MKKHLVTLGMILTLQSTLMTGCSSVQSTEIKVEQAPVKVEKIVESQRSRQLYYTGIVKAEKIQKLAFKNGGLAEKIYVQAGDAIVKEQVLMEQDTSDFSLGLQGAKAQHQGANAMYQKAVNGASLEDIEQARLNANKAKEGYVLAEQTYLQIASLLEKGAVSKFEYDQVKTQMEVSKASYQQAQSVLQQAEKGSSKEDIQGAKSNLDGASVQVKRYEKMMSEASLVAPFEGRVVDVLYEENELIPAGYPAVIIRNQNEIVNIGVSAKDVTLLELGQEVEIESGQKKIKGQIKKIGEAPNQTTRMYDVEISIQKDLLKIGTVVEVKIPLKVVKGIWIPVQIVKVDSGDYVFIKSDEIAVKKYIEIQESIGDEVLVKGLNVGDEMIVKGDRSLEDGQLVRPVEGEGQDD